MLLQEQLDACLVDSSEPMSAQQLEAVALAWAQHGASIHNHVSNGCCTFHSSWKRMLLQRRKQAPQAQQLLRSLGNVDVTSAP